MNPTGYDSEAEDDRRIEENGKRLDAAVRDLYEHFDTVQIFATNHENETTDTQTRGKGNWFARFGQIKVWVTRQGGQTAGQTSSGENE